ncbi:MAG: hypothetical protein OXJ90_03915 [Spirochaetaceae bacterium]|nr:hypothetical protein [Spirochaetaceae bacterium]
MHIADREVERLAVTESRGDGVVFDRHYLLGGDESAGSRLPGHHKGDRYGYPVLHLDGDSAYAIHSIEKEDVAVCRFRLRDLT